MFLSCFDRVACCDSWPHCRSVSHRRKVRHSVSVALAARISFGIFPLELNVTSQFFLILNLIYMYDTDKFSGVRYLRSIIDWTLVIKGCGPVRLARNMSIGWGLSQIRLLSRVPVDNRLITWMFKIDVSCERFHRELASKWIEYLAVKFINPQSVNIAVFLCDSSVGGWCF